MMANIRAIAEDSAKGTVAINLVHAFELRL